MQQFARNTFAISLLFALELRAGPVWKTW